MDFTDKPTAIRKGEALDVARLEAFLKENVSCVIY
jgi:hypothetical protein